MILFYEKVSPNEARITTQLYDGSVLTEEEKAKGIEIEYIPEPEQVRGKTATLYYNLSTHQLFYKYTDVPVPDEVATLQQEVAMLTEFIADLIGGAI